MTTKPATPHNPKLKPRLRGMLHEGAAYTMLPAACLLVARARTPVALGSAVTYAVGAWLLFAISAFYHRPTWDPKTRALLRKVDHAGIGFMIAGTATPLAMLSVAPERALRVLLLVWGAALVIILKAIFWKSVHKPLNALIYVAISAGCVPFFMDVRVAIGHQNSLLILAGGAAYILGALAYALKKPDPWPRVFGYHEIFHLCTLVAAGLHYSVIWRLVGQGAMSTS